MCTNDEEEARHNALQTFTVNNSSEANLPEVVRLVLERWPSKHLDSRDSLLVPLNECHYCRKEVEDPIICAGCKRRSYCSTFCQLKHWDLHKALCGEFSREDAMRESIKHVKHNWDAEPSNFTRHRDYGCQNDYWMPPPEPNLPQSGPKACYGWTLFASIILSSVFWDVNECNNTKCCERRQMLLKAAPACEWTPFRDFLLTMFSCHASLSPLKYLHQIGACIQRPLGAKYSSIPRYPCFDVYGIFSLWRWSYRFYFGPWNNPNLDRFDFKGHELQTIDVNAICVERNLCPSRFWNLTLQNRDAAVHLEHIAAVAKTFPLSSSKTTTHSQCTDQICLQSHENSTLIHQAHKCYSGTCSDIYELPVDALNEVYKDSDLHSWQQSAWSIQDQGNLCESEDKYIALSHVWSHGTGVGVNGIGRVNQCLFDFFATMAKDLGCVGIWWDAVCLPTARDQRRKAMNVMLKNYENAAYTVIYDQELANFRWREDGSPAVALILSAWFTRGWTAAELYASRKHKVKVVFAKPDARGYLLKDLDDDVLVMHINTPGERFDVFHELPHPDGAVPLGLVPSMGHFMASDIVRQLRPDVDDDLELDSMSITRNLLRLLNSRATAWTRDKLLIAGLLCLPTFAFESTATSVEVSRSILVEQKWLNLTDLLHGCAPMSPNGPWSWCPPSIFDFGHAYTSTLLGAFPNAEVLNDGILDCGRGFLIYPMQEEDELFPLSSHPSVTRKISLARSQWKKCMLLEPSLGIEQQRGSEYIIACPVKQLQRSDEWIDEYEERTGGRYEFLGCRWIGCARAKLAHRDFARKIGILFGDDLDEDGDELPAINVEPLIWEIGERHRTLGDSEEETVELEPD